MKTSLGATYCILVYLQLSTLVCCQVLVFPIEISPDEPINGESTTLECLAVAYDPSIHDFTWRRGINDTLVSVTADDRIVFDPVQLATDTVYSQTVTISRLKESDEGQYVCEVRNVSTGEILGNGQGDLYVSYPNEFPVCTPDGPADVVEGDSLSCRTVIDARIPGVRNTDDPSGEREDWTMISLDACKSGSGLEKNVSTLDDGQVFFCFSIVGDIRKTLSCQIGPLTVSPFIAPTIKKDANGDAACLTSNVCNFGIVAIAFGVIVIFLSIVINLLFCRYDPRRFYRLVNFCAQLRPLDRNSDLAHTENRFYETSISGPTTSTPETTKNPKQNQPHTYADVTLDLESSSRFE